MADRVAALRFETSPGHLLRRAQQVHTDLWSMVVGPQLTGPQYGTLVAIAGWPDVDQKQVGALISLDKSTIAGIVLRLEAKGWLARQAHPRDRRRRLLILTDSARANLSAWTDAASLVQARLLEPLGAAERHAFVRQLQTVVFGGAEPLPDAPIRSEPVVELAHSPGYLIRRAQQVHAASWGTIIPTELTGPQFAVLLAVANGERMDQASIGARASLDSSNVADIVARLADNGWITRTRDQADRRRMLVRLTPAAVAALPSLGRSVERVQQQLLSGLGERANEFIWRLQRVARLGEHPPVLATASRPR